jgi:glycosyltransferase involved in cell wall biosynthesis
MSGLSQRARVLHVLPNLNYGGMERLLTDIVLGLPREQFESHVLTLEYVGRFGAELQGVAEVHCVVPPRGISMVWPASIIAKIRSIAPHVVHTHSGVWFKGTHAARLAGVPRVVHTEHGRLIPDPWIWRHFDAIAARRTDVIAAVSEPLRSYLARHIVHDPSKIRVVRNAVDTARCVPRVNRGLRDSLDIATSAPVIGSVGRLERIKGYDIAVRAYALLRSRWTLGAPPVLVLAGDGSEREKLAAEARTLGVADGVRFLGWRDDLAELLGLFTLFTMSSRSEGTSVSLLEAMSAGLCPVVTDVGGNRDVLGSELKHRLVPPLDPDALAAAWLDALSDSNGRARDGAAARARVLEHFDLRRMVHAYASMYIGEQRATAAA